MMVFEGMENTPLIKEEKEYVVLAIKEKRCILYGSTQPNDDLAKIYAERAFERDHPDESSREWNFVVLPYPQGVYAQKITEIERES